MARPEGDGRGRLGGRAKGTPNKITSEIRKEFADFIVGNFDDFKESFCKISDPEKKCKVYMEACKFVLPSLTKVDVTGGEAVGSSLTEYLRQARTEIAEE